MASSRSKRRSMSAPTWVSAAFSDSEWLATRAAGGKGLGSARASLAVEPDRLDPRLRRVESLGAQLAQRVAAFVQVARVLPRHLAALQPADDPFQLRQRGFERQVGGWRVHTDAMRQAGEGGQLGSVLDSGIGRDRPERTAGKERSADA